MAYLREIDRECRCGKRAVVELVNRRNATHGVYCRSCGARALRELLRDEEREDRKG